jgi:hypothetical protein
MSIRYWLRAAVLCAAFGLAVWTIQSLNQKGLSPQLAAAIGAIPTVNSQVNLCETRVQGLKTADGTDLHEEGFSWVMNGIQHRQLDPVAVEKWFGYNCTVAAQDLRPVAKEDLEAANTVLQVSFIQGGVQFLKQTANGLFIWKKSAFRSSQLDKAIHQLSFLGEAAPDGRTRPSSNED